MDRKIKLKMAGSFLAIIIIMTLILIYLGSKLKQQDYINNRSELWKIESQLRELGVEVCLIQPMGKNGGITFAMLSFWETDSDVLLSRLGNIKNLVLEYVRKSEREMRFPVIKYFDADGFPLDDTLKAAARVEFNETNPDFYEVVIKFIGSLEGKLRPSFDGYLDPSDYRIKIYADTKHDVTTGAYGAKQIFFFARFNQANTEKLKAVRILYKRLSNFNETRGDDISFYNMDVLEYNLIDSMVEYVAGMKKDPALGTAGRIVVYQPFDLHRYTIMNFVDDLEAPSPTPDSQPGTSPSPASSSETPAVVETSVHSRPWWQVER